MGHVNGQLERHDLAIMSRSDVFDDGQERRITHPLDVHLGLRSVGIMMSLGIAYRCCKDSLLMLSVLSPLMIPLQC